MSPARTTRSRPVLPRSARTAASAAIAVLALPAAAGAAVSGTTVTAPSDGAVVEGPYEIGACPLGGAEPDLVTVRGVAPGAADGDEVVLVCEARVDGAAALLPLRTDTLTIGDGPLAAERTVVRDGAFSAVVVAPNEPCRIRAVPPELAPADSLPVYRDAGLDLSAYAGPRVLGDATFFIPQVGSPFEGADFGLARRSADRGLTEVTTLAYGIRGGPHGLGLSGATGGLARTAVVDDVR